MYFKSLGMRRLNRVPEGHLSLQVGEMAEVAIALEEPGHVVMVEVAHHQRQDAQAQPSRPRGTYRTISAVFAY